MKSRERSDSSCPSVRRAAAYALIAFPLAVLPANIHAAHAGMPLRGKPATNLWARVPMQVLCIVRAVWAGPCLDSARSQMKDYAMKAKSSAGLRPPAKDRHKPKTVDEYFASVPHSVRPFLTELRAVISEAVPTEATETISYGIPAFQDGKVLVWFAAFRDHVSLFPTASVIDAFRKELKGFKTSKGTIQFPIGQPLPSALIERIVKARVAQNTKRRT